jgi:hypothetical protein
MHKSMLKIPKINPLILTLLLSSSFFFSSCGGNSSTSNSSQQSKQKAPPLDPQELGYYKEFGELWQSAANSTYSLLEIDSVAKLNSEVKKAELSDDQKAKLKSASRNLKDMADKELPTLEQTLPPISIESLHLQWVSLLKTIRTSNTLDEAVIAQSKSFYEAYSKLSEDFKDRPKDIQPDDGSISVGFKPVFSPVAVNVNPQSGAFELVFSREIVTPVGSASVDITSQQQSASPSPKFLVVKHNERRRYVYLSPGSKFFIPATCGVDLLNEREDSKIIIEVVKCTPEEAIQPESIKTSPPENLQTLSSESQKDFDTDRIKNVVNTSVLFISQEKQKLSGNVMSSEVRNTESNNREFLAEISWEDKRQSSIVFKSDYQVIVSISDVQYKGKWSWKDSDQNILLVEMDRGSRYIFGGS